MAILLGDTVWEGLSTEARPTYAEGARDGHFLKELDTGESYIRKNGVFEYINLGLSFVKATKSGKATTNALGRAEIIFATPFIDNNYSITLTCEEPSSPPVCIPFSRNQMPGGFYIRVRAVDGAPKPNVAVSWLATRDYNP